MVFYDTFNSVFFGSGYDNNTVSFTPFATPILTNKGFSWIVIKR